MAGNPQRLYFRLWHGAPLVALIVTRLEGLKIHLISDLGGVLTHTFGHLDIILLLIFGPVGLELGKFLGQLLKIDARIICLTQSKSLYNPFAA